MPHSDHSDHRAVPHDHTDSAQSPAAQRSEIDADTQPPAAVARAAEHVESWLADRLQQWDLPDNLREAIAYATLGPGKRLRPALTMLSCEAVGGDAARAMAPAAALEFIHCFSLVHDDLPAMDDDELRRGRPTLHVHAGEAMAILAGDAMLSLAFDLILSEDQFAPAIAQQMCRELSRATTAMIAGQVYDTLGGFPPNLTGEQRLRLIHSHKTGALMRGACRMGALAGNAGEAALQAITSYGEAVGLMFQIVDDVLDVTQSTEHLGKQSRKDAEAGKLTFPALLGLESSQREIDALLKVARESLTDLGPQAEPLIELADFLAIRTR